MPFSAKAGVPLRLRVLLGLITAAGAGVYLTYSAAVRPVSVFAESEAGARLQARLDLAAALTEADVAAAIARAAGLASAPSSQAARRAAMAAGRWPELLAAWTSDAKGRAVSALKGLPAPAGAGGPASPSRPGTQYGAGALEYETTTRYGTASFLHCRFRAAPLPQEARAGGVKFRFARRRGNELDTGGDGGAAILQLKSRGAEMFLPALEGKEGFAVKDGSEKLLYAYRRLPGADWVMTAEIPYAAAAPAGSRLTSDMRLSALLIFALLAITAFFAAGAIMTPVSRTARAAAALLEGCGRQPLGPDEQPAAELIDEAIKEASAWINSREAAGAQMQEETQKLREEEADLRSQNAELEKLNNYLSEREARISELRRELEDLKEKAAGEK